MKFEIEELEEVSPKHPVTRCSRKPFKAFYYWMY